MKQRYDLEFQFIIYIKANEKIDLTTQWILLPILNILKIVLLHNLVNNHESHLNTVSCAINTLESISVKY